MNKSIFSNVGMLLVSLMLAGEFGCGKGPAAVGDETTHHSSLVTHPSSISTHQPDEEFPLPADREGRLLADNLRPSNQIPRLGDDKIASPKRRSGAAKLDNPDVPLPPVIVNSPAPIPLAQAKTKPVQPRLLQGEAPLNRDRIETAGPVAIKLHAGPKIAWPSPDVNQPIPLPILARPVVDRASLDDPSGDASQAAALASTVPGRTTPAPFLRLSLPDPFEHRNVVRLRIAPKVELGPIQRDLIRVPLR